MEILNIMLYLKGFNSLGSITAMAIVRYLSVVRMQQTWHADTKMSFWLSRPVWLVWLFALLFAAPPLVGFCQYKKDESMFWYENKVVRHLLTY